MKAMKFLPTCIAVTLPLFSASIYAADVEGFNFSGYARYGAAFQGSDEKTVNTAGALNGNATGRLGNENNGGEFSLSRTFTGEQGARWDIVVMFDHYSDSSWATTGGVKLKKTYASVTNFVSSQPELRVWAGRDFHQRAQTDLNDYFWMMHDGQGGGFYNLNLAGVKLDMSVVGQVEGDMVGDSGKYALTTKLHDMKIFGLADLALYANYGFASKKAKEQPYYDIDSYQVGGEISAGKHKLIVRYSDNAKDSVFDMTEDQKALLFSFNGEQEISNDFGVQYLAAYQSLDVADFNDRVNYNVIVRPTYAWDNMNSTWLDTGFSLVDYKHVDAKNSSWKVTLSQNIAISSKTWARPMLRFYAAIGKADNEYIGFDSSTGQMKSSNLDTATFGAMFEAWW
ncbi:carbohydrate porin [Vibrio navarrensis]|uniref:carbohydrate porin n=1 Tax=Vibrio navarrensis TaxID=29495 RepID=UPI00186A47FE|nr:carbohydrate porin [Vibrio navarrensis]MBE4609490.1 lactam utilization protein LamB [Vibrio navarrensis]MBE4613193.1 lactam utilization protein LamB [Vibrio navarrensis]